MSHYDLYESLGLSRQSSTADLAAELEARIADLPASDTGLQDQLVTARAILGDETRRSLYDQRLDDPTAPTIDIVSLRELAALNTAGPVQGAGESKESPATGAQVQQQAGSFARQAGDRAAAAGHQVQESFKQSNLMAIGITAVVTALVVGLLGWATGLFGGDEFKAQKSFVNDFLSQDDEGDLRDWITENSIVEARDELMSDLLLEDGQSFTGLDAAFGGSDLGSSDTVLTVEQMKMSTMEDNDEFYEGLEDEGVTREEIDSMTIVGIVDGSDEPRGGAMLIKRDGDHKLITIFTQ